MSKIINGDITAVTTGAIMQQVNCQGAMGAGVALAILKKWSHVRPEYVDYCQRKSPAELFGDVQQIQLTPDLMLFNSFSQFDYGIDKKQTDEQILIANIQKYAEVMAHADTILYVPYLIGCGLAGGHWPTVYNGIKDIDNLIIVQF